MPESKPCPNCGRFHEPGPCPKEVVLEKPKKELTPEEQQEQEKMQGQLEDELAHGSISFAEAVIFFCEDKQIALDFSKPEIVAACQRGLEVCLSNGYIFSIDISKSEIITAGQKGLETRLQKGYISSAEEVISFCEDKHIALDTTTACQKGLELLLSNGYIPAVEEVVSFCETKGIILDFKKPEIIAACQKGLEYRLPEGGTSAAKRIISFCEPKSITLDFDKPEFNTACQKGLENCLAKGNISDAEMFIRCFGHNHATFDIGKPKITALCQKGLECRLSEGYLYYVKEIISFSEKKNINLNFNKPEIVVACQKGLESRLSNGDISDAEEAVSFCEDKRIVFDVTSACQKGVESLLFNGHISHAKKVVSFYENKHIVFDFSKPEMATACQKGLESSLSNGDILSVEKFISFCEGKPIALDLSKPEVAIACQKGLESRLSNGDISHAEEVISFCEGKLIALDIATACQKGLELLLLYGYIFGVKEIISFCEQKGIALDLGKLGIDTVCHKGLESHLSIGDISGVEEIRLFCEDKRIALDLSKHRIVTACQKGFGTCLSRGNFTNVKNIISFCEKNSITLDIITPCEKVMEKLLLSGKGLESVAEINQLFLRISSEKFFELYSHHLPLEELNKYLPSLILQAQKSIEFFFGLFEYRENLDALINIVKKNPFLRDALTKNLRFGSKLILKYPEFDQTSRSKIKFLFENKENILKDNPDLDPESLEFRRMMQDKLLKFERNQKIVEESKKSGIDTDEWLNYEKTEYFTLKSGEETIPFSERVSTPLDRLGQTIGSYAHQIKVVLSEWREDLLKLEIEPASVEEDKIKIIQMEDELDKAQQAGEERKAQGLSRGLDGMKQKLGQVKKVPLWNRLMSEIDGFAKLKDSLVKSQESLILTEQKYDEFASFKAPSGEELSKLKSQISQAKEDFRKRLGQLERRLETFRTNFPILISGLGKDRATSLEQELNEKMAEQFSHYDSDRQALESLFSKRADKEKGEIEDRPMSVFVWARNPDIDLYQGNYSPCCICIDSKHMGSECTIADYATDLGVQIVNIWDEQKNVPVVAAWCWLGKNENGKTALVVDNIEANVQYSSNFPRELTQELFDYLKKYAKTVGVDSIVLGKYNNDLPTKGEMDKLQESVAQYSKLGGENARSGGYFLEAEEANVKLLWEKVKRKKLEKIELEDLLTKELSSEDFADIIKLEEQLYEDEMVRGQTMIDDLNNGEGLNYSAVLYGKRPNQTHDELLGYLVAFKDKTDEGVSCVYLDDIAVAPDCQGMGLGWNLLEKAITRLKVESKKQGKSILFNMHLREGSQQLFEKHKEDLERLGVSLVESDLVPDYFDEGEDALYCVYEVKAS